MTFRPLLRTALLSLAALLAWGASPTPAMASPPAAVSAERAEPRAPSAAQTRSYAEREAKTPAKKDLEGFRGGQVVIVLSTAAAVVLVVILLVLLL